jgi:hypothetical protein
MTTKWSFAIGTAALAIALAGCGNKQATETSETPAAAPAGAAAAVDPATAGSVTGSVTLDGTAPTPKPINMSAEPYCQKAHTAPVVPQDVVVGDKGALANVVVTSRTA